MLRTLQRLRPYLVCGLLPIVDHDKFAETKTAIEMRKIKLETETPMNRLYMMFSIDEFGSISPELNSVYQTAICGAFFGTVYGGFIRSKLAYEDFLSNNQATSFHNPQDAKKKLQTQVTTGFAKGAFMWGWRLALFTGTYALITTVISVYRDRSSIIEYLTAGGVIGTMYKIKLGPKGMLVGGGLGMALGAMAGSVSLVILYLTNTTVQEMRYWQYQIRQTRDKNRIEALTQLHEEKDPLMEDHKRLIEARGPQQDIE